MGKPLLFFLIFAVVLLVLLFFPIYVDLSACYDMNGRKCAFSVRIYKLVKLVGGYIATYKGGLAVHISEQKAILVPYSDLDNERKRFSIMRAFRLKTLNVTLETGTQYLLPIMLAQNIFHVYFLTNGGKKEKLKSDLWLRQRDMLRITLNFMIRFNLFIILRSIFKYVKEKIVVCQTKIKRSIS